MAKLTIIEGNSNEKDNVRAYMVKGERGDDGISPTVETSKTGSTTTVTITDGQGTHEAEILDGFTPTVTASKTNKVTTLTITDINGTETTTINDGVDLTGGVPTNGIIGFDGNVSDIPNGYEVSTENFGGGLPTGAITQFAGSTAPSGYLICDGSAISRTDYSLLFAVIGTNYGTGDGSTTFNIPNLKGKVPVGLDSSQTEFDVLGETGGEKTHTLTTDEIPSHTHTVSTSNNSVNVQSGSNYGVVGAGSHSTGTTGGGQAHNNLQPYIVMNYIIKC